MSEDGWTACLTRYEAHLRDVERSLQQPFLDDAGIVALVSLSTFAVDEGLGPLPAAQLPLARRLHVLGEQLCARVAQVHAVTAEALRRAGQPTQRPAAVFVDEAL